MNSGGVFKSNCNCCHKFVHKSADCTKKKNDLENRGNNIVGPRQENIYSLLIVQEMEIAYMAEEIEYGYCVHCGGRGPLGTFCDRCVDSSCIYARQLFEDEGRGDYWEEPDDEEEEEEEEEDEDKDKDKDKDKDE
jgi:hypothetical protein